MIATAHVIIGGTVGVLTKNPAAGFLAGVASHLICDAIPHLDGPLYPQYENGDKDKMIWTRGIFIFALADSLFAFLITLFLWNKYFDLSIVSSFVWGALGGYLPDFIDVVPFWRDTVRKIPILKQFHEFHLALHVSWQTKFPMIHYWPLGIATQLIIALPCLWFIVK